ncbi:MAG: choice-of-anchor D domain-containing protein [Myxococcales bacterium]|nr:choice-of-anchor D domain-containing protein [Myxococcales bacterium]
MRGSRLAFSPLAFSLLALAACGGTAPPIDEACANDEDCPAGTLCRGGLCETPADSGTPVGAPEIEVTPPTLDFGSASLGVQVTHELVIENHGNEPLHVTRLELIEGDALAEYTSVPTGAGAVALELAPGGSLTIAVTLVQQDTEADRGELRISSDDADEPVFVVTLLSEIKGTPQLSAAPDELDYGVVTWRDVVAREVDIENTGTGNAPLTITAADVTDASGGALLFTTTLLLVDPSTGAESPALLPVHLSPGGGTLRARVVLDSSLSAGGQLPAETLRIRSNDADPLAADLRVPILGTVFGCAAPAPEVCNGLDDNCDLVADDGDPGAGGACLSTLPGACALGSRHCVAGALTCVAIAAPVVESCNGTDDDCDGETDEALLRACSSACGSGVEFCVVGSWLGCNAPDPDPEYCNGEDDDCDGVIDDGDPGGGAPCVTGEPGICSSGALHCAAGTFVCVRLTPPGLEGCNGLDDDCDGLTDEGDPGAGASCTTGQLGVCATGLIHCVAGTLACVRIVEPSAETCNTLDDDCDGVVDDGNPDGGATCDGSDADSCRDGTFRCEAGALVCDDGPSFVVDICNGLDDDCDPTTVDGNADPLLGAACDGTDTDLCIEGTRSCALGALVCTDTTGSSLEACNGADDDCNAVVDDGGAALCAPPPNATAACNGFSGCGISACFGGFGNCDGVVANGCESPLLTDEANCGSCGVICAPGRTCTGGICSGTCGNGVLDPGEEYEPPPGPFTSAPVSPGRCRYDFSAVRQLYCNGTCSWSGSDSCDQTEADILCKLKKDNPLSVATSWRATTALPEPGFPCTPLGYGTPLTSMASRGVAVAVSYQDSSILADHGGGTVIVDVVCTNP